MAFSFRNLFKKDEENSSEQTGGEHQSANPFGGRERRADGAGGNQGGGHFSDSPFSPGGTRPAPQSTGMLPITVPASQIISHIPKEMVNPNGIVTDTMVRLPAAGPSGGLKLMEVFQACPTLFSYAPDIRDTREVFVGVHADAGVQGNQQMIVSPFAAAPAKTPSSTSFFTEAPQSSAQYPEQSTPGAMDQGAASAAVNPFDSGPLVKPFQEPDPAGTHAAHPPQAPPFETGFFPQNQHAVPETGSLNPETPQGGGSPFQPAGGPSTGHGEPIAEPLADTGGEGFFQTPKGNTHLPPARPMTQELDPSALPFAPAPRPVTHEESGEIELSLLNLLRGVAQEDLGFDPEEVPADVRTQLPLSLIRPQLSSGHVVVPLAAIIAGCEKRFHRAFVNAREDVEVPLPLQEIFHNLPAGLPVGPSTAEIVARQHAEGAPIFDPSAPESAPEEAHVEEVSPQEPAPAAQQPWEEPAAAIPEAYAGLVTPPPGADAGEDYPEAKEETPVHPQIAEASQQELPGPPTRRETGKSNPARPPFSQSFEPTVDLPAKASVPTGASPFSSGGLTSEQLLGSPFSPVSESSVEPVPPVPFPPHQGAAPEPPAPAPAAPEPQANALHHAAPEHHGDDFASFDQQTDLDQLALRAIFQVEHRLTAQDVIDLCCGLTGVSACVALHPGGALTAEENGISGFGEDAAGMFQNVAGLARGLGIGEADTFTIRTRKGTFSFFSQGEICLGVLHDPGHPAFGPGIREKLFLVTRELGPMIGG